MLFAKKSPTWICSLSNGYCKHIICCTFSIFNPLCFSRMHWWMCDCLKKLKLNTLLSLCLKKDGNNLFFNVDFKCTYTCTYVLFVNFRWMSTCRLGAELRNMFSFCNNKNHSSEKRRLMLDLVFKKNLS